MMKNNTSQFWFFFLLVGFFSFPADVKAQNPMQQIMPGVERGEIRGKITLKQDKIEKALENYPYSIVVYQNQTQVLRLTKKTDANGEFTIKNVFISPDFFYYIATQHQDQIYVIERLQLHAGQKVKEINFRLGKDSPYLLDATKVQKALEFAKQQANNNQAMAPLNRQVRSKNVSFEQRNWHFALLLFLSGLVLVVLVYQLFWGRSFGAPKTKKSS